MNTIDLLKSLSTWYQNLNLFCLWSKYFLLNIQFSTMNKIKTNLFRIRLSNDAILKQKILEKYFSWNNIKSFNTSHIKSYAYHIK